MVEYLAHHHSQARSTIWRWYKGYRKLGLFGLVDPPRKDKGTSHFFGKKKHRDAALLVAIVYAVQRQSVATAYDALRRDAALAGLRPEQVPSYSCVYAF